MNSIFWKFQKTKKHEFKSLQVDTHRAFDSGSVYLICEFQGHEGFSFENGSNLFRTFLPLHTGMPHKS